MLRLTVALILAAAPELFAPGVISTVDDETSIAFSADGQTAYFTKRSPSTNTPPRWFICSSTLVDGRWTQPVVAPFSGLDNDLGPALSVDGRRLYFASDRRRADAGASQPALALWSVEQSADGSWSDPRPLPAPVNAESDSFAPSVAADGTLYFASSRPGGKGSVDLYRAVPTDGGYAGVEALAAVNSPAYEGQPAVAPDQRFLLFTGVGRDDAQVGPGYPYPRADLYLSVRTPDGFGPPRPVRELNTPATEASPSLSPDQRFLYFASDRGFATVPMRRRLTAAAFKKGVESVHNGWSNIYRVPLQTLGLPPGEERR